MFVNYWSSTLHRRLSRRRALAGAAMFGGAAAFLAACGGDDDGPAATGGTGGSDLVTQPRDTSDQAVRGGSLRAYVTAEPQTLDPATPVAPLNYISGYVYGTLLNEEPGYLSAPQGELYGDFADSWEFSPDRLQINIKIKRGIKWHNKAPVNGREADIDDVIFSWRRYAELSPVASVSYNGRNPDAPIMSVVATDPETIQVTLSEPVAYGIRYLAAFGSHTGNMILMPKEADGGFDPRSDMIGHGPFVLAQVVPSVGYTMRRNPEYYDQNAALLDEIQLPIVLEYAGRLAQLKAGNFHRLLGEVGLTNDLSVTKREQPALQIYPTPFSPNRNIIVFGQLPPGESKFLDKRVRQAFSMAIDRDAWIDATYNISGLEADGLPVESRWNSHMIADWVDPDYWLDPEGSAFGANAKFLRLDLAEAKALLSAAGHPNGFDVRSNYSVERLNFAPSAEPIDGMLRELGLNISVNTPDYASDYIPNYRDGNGQYEGYAYATVLGTQPQVLHPVASLAAEYWPKGGNAFRGFAVGTANDKSGDPELTRMIERARLEFDTEELIDQLHEIQRYLADEMWGLNLPGGATGYTAVWPAVRNHGVWRRTRQGGFSEWDPYRLWLDQTQPPFT